MLLHPQIIEKEGKKEFVVLPYEEFLKIQETLEDFEDLRELRREREESIDKPSRSLREIGKELGFEPE
ncbi:MAG: type II toxin-antitoxin system Phd/YefM family antitoxin [Desulfomonile tiedjei]|nr:type II toxin-antitoxin system Phd/YefM family antitoxin [Desulfomonile tiedjei]